MIFFLPAEAIQSTVGLICMAFLFITVDKRLSVCLTAWTVWIFAICTRKKVYISMSEFCVDRERRCPSKLWISVFICLRLHVGRAVDLRSRL